MPSSPARRSNSTPSSHSARRVLYSDDANSCSTRVSQMATSVSVCQRDGLRLKRAAVDQERVTGAAERGDELIHDADLRADICVFRFLPGEREFDAVNLDPGD
jgi:hypothetical protein